MLTKFSFNSPQLLFETIIDYLANFSVSEDMFQAVKESIGRSYYNHIIKPNKLNK